MSDIDNIIAALNNAGLYEVPPAVFDLDLPECSFAVQPLTVDGAARVRIIIIPNEREMVFLFRADGQCEEVTVEDSPGKKARRSSR